MGWFVSALTVSEKLATFHAKMRDQEDAKRESLARYFEVVSKTLLEVSTCIDRKEPADFHLGRLHVYGAELPEICKGIVDEREAWELGRQLPHYWPPVSLLQLQAPNDETMPMDFAAEYRRCAGAFQALADSIRIRK